MRSLLKYFKGYGAYALLGPVFKLLEACFELTMPIIMATLVNNAFGNPTYFAGHKIPLTTAECGIALACITVSGFLMALTCNYFATLASMGFGAQLRSALFKHISSLSHREIDLLPAASFTNRLTADVIQIQQAVTMFIRLVLRAPVLALGALAMVIIIDKTVAVIFGISIPVVGFAIFFIMKKTVPMYKKVQGGLDKIGLVTRENLTGARVVRAFSRQEKEIARGEEAAEGYYKDTVRVNRISALLNPLASLIMNIGIALIVVVGAAEVGKGKVSSAEISSFITYILWILLALTIIANISVIITRALSSAERIKDVFDIAPSVTEKGINALPDFSAPPLAFKNVFFRYNETNYVLKDVSFEVFPGESLALIGGTGSGKSTVASLAARFYDASSGEVTVFGKNVKDYDQAELKKLIAVVIQNSSLMSGTLRENIAWGYSEPDDKRIISALKTAEAWEFVSKLKEGLDAKVNAGGTNFSGGQVQRLTIARALYRRPKILVLDDSAGALDFATEARLRKNLKKLSPEITVVTISQRAGSVRHSDRILVLDKGSLAGNGGHKELLAASPVYREICLTQFKEEELDAD